MHSTDKVHISRNASLMVLLRDTVARWLREKATREKKNYIFLLAEREISYAGGVKPARI